MSQDETVLTLVVTLALASVTALLVDSLDRSVAGKESSRQFQRMAGGLGMGASVAPRWCFVNFDPRIEQCTCAEQPLAGGYCYCPEHAGTVSFFSDYRLSLTTNTDSEAARP